MNNPKYHPMQEKARVAFKEISNTRGGFNEECSKQAGKVVKSKVVKSKSHKRNIATIYTVHGSSGILASKKISVTQDEDEEVQVQETKEHTSIDKNKLRQPTKVTTSSVTISSLSKKHYQDGPADDIDERDSDDPLSATSYVQDIYKYYGEEEHRAVVGPYLSAQPEINERMRSILVDWLCEVHHKCKMKFHLDALYLTINIVDRYLAANTKVLRKKLQLVGVTALLIATKYEEIYPMELNDLVYVCDRAYSKLEILDMEEIILKKLEYRITLPTGYMFLKRYLNAAHPSKQLCFLSSYLLEESLLSYNLTIGFKPSQLAAAAILISRKVTGRNAWSPTLLKYALYREEDITPVARVMLAERSRVSQAVGLTSVKKKYSRSSMFKVAYNNERLENLDM